METGIEVFDGILNKIEKRMDKEFEGISPDLQQQMIYFTAEVHEFKAFLAKVGGEVNIFFVFPACVELIQTKRSGVKNIYYYSMNKSGLLTMSLADFERVLAEHGFTRTIDKSNDKLTTIYQNPIFAKKIRISISKAYEPLKQKLVEHDREVAESFGLKLMKKNN